LSKDERNLGIALVDIGGGSTSVAVFEDGELKGATVIPLGGDNITKDLSIVLKTTTEESERIKITHGHAFIEDDAEEEVFTIPVIGSDKRQTCNQFVVSDIMEARLIEIFELVQDEIFLYSFYPQDFFVVFLLAEVYEPAFSQRFPLLQPLYVHPWCPDCWGSYSSIYL